MGDRARGVGGMVLVLLVVLLLLLSVGIRRDLSSSYYSCIKVIAYSGCCPQIECGKADCGGACDRRGRLDEWIITYI